ncbi:hypothetical protein CH380_17125 [Leptospira adleri]|uniref:Uncharacterized protein n=1 Tax=Leptospira adleri TaxID=2023186 RepID=A0A2M9YKA2_9LEPT|nr:hypothetical protein CH380_17125 [Leptospira adleri]PJZ60404.1 hypothetical protein CH376_18570 [Leptospira adleri]
MWELIQKGLEFYKKISPFVFEFLKNKRTHSDSQDRSLGIIRKNEATFRQDLARRILLKLIRK